MNTTVGVYDTHEKAIEAVQELKRAGYPVQQVSLIGKAVVIDDLMHVKHNRRIKNVPAITGAILGPILGMLTGVKLFAIPGLGFLFGIGAVLGALAGFSLGIVGGGVITLFAILVIKSHAALKYREHIEEKGFQVIAHGNNIEVNRAKEILDGYKNKVEIKESLNMNAKRITTALCFIVFVVTIMSCDNGQGMMHGSNRMGMNSYNWTQILISLGVICLIGFIIWVVISRRKK